MSAINERNISRFLFNPFSVYVADLGDAQPAVPSFYTEPAMTFNFNKEYVAAEAYNAGSGVLYTVRQDLQRFNFMANFTVKETTIPTLQLAHGGTQNSDGSVLVLDGSVTNKSFWFESLYNDDSKIIRISIPIGKNVEASEMSGGEAHFTQPIVCQALPNIVEVNTLPTIYIEL